MEKQYWQSFEEYEQLKKQSLRENGEPLPEFSIEGLDESEIKGKSSRRDFLKMLGFSVGTVALVSSCQMPVRKAIPFLNQPEELIPGVPNFYASTFFDGIDYCSILVKTRESRPIKIEGNEMSPLTRGGTSVRVQASVLNLYDDARLRNPRKGEVDSDWETVDRDIINKLEYFSGKNEKVVLLTSTIISPATRKLISDFIAKYPNVKWMQYDAVSYSAIRQAHKQNFGDAVIPFYCFDKADVVVSFNADFLGNWLMPVTFTKQYVSNRHLMQGNIKLSRLFQYESRLSLTGSNADYRFGIRPSEESAVLLNLYNEIAKATGNPTYYAPPVSIEIKQAAKDLLAAKGKSLVVSGTNNVRIQLIVNAINQALGNYGKTLDMNQSINLKQGDEAQMLTLVDEMKDGLVQGLLVYNVNPVYDYPDHEAFIEGMNKVDLKVSLSETLDETGSLCNYVGTVNNYLESWDDAEPVRNSYSFVQPAIRPIFNTRQFQDSLMKWAGMGAGYAKYLENFWNSKITGHSTEPENFPHFWNKLKQDGVFQVEQKSTASPRFVLQELSAETPLKDGLEVILYEKISIGTGKYTNNPWLLELPDPITTATWDNYVCVPVAYARKNNLNKEDVVMVNGNLELPVIVQPGQPEGTVSIALGFGRTAAGKAGNGVGRNVYPLMNTSNGRCNVSGTPVTIEKIEGKTYELALTQMHHTMEGRPIFRETTLKDYIKDPSSGNKQHKIDEEKNVSLYSMINFDAIHWGMTVDLNSCTGCANCVIACQSENNIPVIGKDQVRRRRIMQWMRIDRYYSDDPEMPDVYHMPVMCQQCDNAPCENVCPVAAVTHSSEGLNQTTYNRCIGTRYCINNCPYRTRRFNWYEYVNNNEYDYNMNSDLGKLVLNPDVTVRQRGVVEKCTYCVQRLQAGKLTAKIENREIIDGEIQTACSQSCPANAIRFGNLLQEGSKINEINKEERMYYLLEPLHTLPSTSYLTKVRNWNS